MSCETVLNVLKSKPNKWFTSKEIVGVLGISYGSVVLSLNILRKNNEVLSKPKLISPRKKSFFYKHKK